MPTPVGHGLAGLAIALSSPKTARSRQGTGPGFALLCAFLAAAPDLDLVYIQTHRTATHSIFMALLLTIVCVGVTGWVNRNRRFGDVRSGDVDSAAVRWRQALIIGVVCGAAWSSHILLDWLGTDLGEPRGIQALWPFSQQWFISGINLFATVERRQPFSLGTIINNVIAVIWEIVIVGPVVLVVWWLRRPRPHDIRIRNSELGIEN